MIFPKMIGNFLQWILVLTSSLVAFRLDILISSARRMSSLDSPLKPLDKVFKMLTFEKIRAHDKIQTLNDTFDLIFNYLSFTTDYDRLLNSLV